MEDLLKNRWINGTDLEVLSTTPLATPDVLSLTRGSVSTVQSQITATLSAFHKAHQAGFRLQDVSNAPLVRRRKRKRDECGSSGSTDSSRASTPVPPFANVPSPLAASTTMSPTPGHTSVSPGTASLQSLSSVTVPASSGTEPLPPSTVVSQPGSALLDLLQRDDRTASCGFSLHNSAASELPGLRHSESSASHNSTPSHSPTSRHPADRSASSRGSTPQRSPLSSAASMTSLGFSPAASAAGSSENSFHDGEAAPLSQIPSSSAVSLSLATSLSHSDGRNRKLADSFGRQSYNGNDDDDDDDDDCIIVGVSEPVMSSSGDCRKPLTHS